MARGREREDDIVWSQDLNKAGVSHAAMGDTAVEQEENMQRSRGRSVSAACREQQESLAAETGNKHCVLILKAIVTHRILF